MDKKKVLYILIAISILFPCTTHAKTIAEFEAEVNKYTAELKEKQNKIAKNDEEIAAVKKNIASIENQIVEAEKEIERLQNEIEESNKKIAEKSAESKKVMQYYQIENGDNAYLEYAFGAESITDMIYRMSVIEQLTEYNDKIMKELQRLIEENIKKKQELNKKEEDLKTLKVKLLEEKAKIEADTQAIRESMPSVETQIKEAQSNVNYFKKLGCGATEDILACQYRISQQNKSSSIPSVGTSARPMDYGYLVRGFSGRNGHMGYDLSSSNKSIPIYPIANGQVHAIYTDACTSGSWCRSMGYSCNGNAKIVVIKHNYNGSYVYSSYVHLSGYGNISEGIQVTKDTVIGYMGTSGCSTGPHLHLEMASCHWKNNGGCTYNQYLNKLINPSSLVNLPGSWSNR